jgi:DNA-binding transcriptional MerR regulator
VEKEQTFTLDEIEERTGFDKRTIAYYVQEGLLPKVGRRGPKTRYSRQFLDRLMFVRKTRDLQDRGRMGTMTLGEIKELFDKLPERTIHDIVTGKKPLDVIENQDAVLEAPAMSPPRARASAAARWIGKLNKKVEKESAPAENLYSLIDLEEEAQQPARMTIEEDRVPADLMDSEDIAVGSRGSDADTGIYRSMGNARYQAPPPRSAEEELRVALRRLLSSVKEASPAEGGSTEHWARAKVVSKIFVIAEDLAREDAYLLEEVVRLLRRLITEADEDW